MNGPLVVSAYNPQWPQDFARLAPVYRQLFADLPVAVEHVGSTAVPGLIAKPILDIDLVVPDPVVPDPNDHSSPVIPWDQEAFLSIERRLQSLGYVCQGTLGIAGRWAYQLEQAQGALAQLGLPLPDHHLYVVLASSEAWANHWRLRDYLRTHPDAVRAYGELKKRLLEETKGDRQQYTAGKTDLITEFLEQAGLDAAASARIRQANLQPNDR